MLFSGILLLFGPLFQLTWSLVSTRLKSADSLFLRGRHIQMAALFAIWLWVFIQEFVGVSLTRLQAGLSANSWKIFDDKTIYLHDYKLFDWSTVFGVNVEFGFHFNTTTFLMCFIVYTIWFAVEVYLLYYLSLDENAKRFFCYFPLFTLCMMIMVLSNNLVQFFMGWEGIGLCSFILINFWHTRVQAQKAALKAVLVNRIGDFFFLVGMVLCWVSYGTLQIDALIPLVITTKLEAVCTIPLLGVSLHNVELICACFFVAAMSKSAQFGLHTWLPDAMEGPTPVSALLHAATMVTAGVFLMVSLSSLFALCTTVSVFITFIGCFTALLGSSIALAQWDIKKIIAYSTCSQLGYMVMACGVGHYTVAFFHLLGHAFFKALLFLCAGVIIHAMGGEQDLRRMGGLKHHLPFVYVAMSIASAALAGIPYLSGYYSKDAIIGILWFQNDWIGYFCGILAIVSAVFTSMYSAGIQHYAFLSTPRWSMKTTLNLNAYKSSDITSHLSLGFLTLLSIFGGFFLRDILIAPDKDVVGGTFGRFSTIENLTSYVEFAPSWFKFMILFAGISGFVFYGIQRLTIGSAQTFVFAPNFSNIRFYKFLYYRWCFDLIYSYYLIGLYVRLSNLVVYVMLQQQVVDKWFLEVFVTQTEQTARLVAQSNGTSAKSYLRYFAVGLVVYSLIFLTLVNPAETASALAAYELTGNK